VWVVNVWGTADLLNAFYEGLIGARISPGSLGAAFSNSHCATAPRYARTDVLAAAAAKPILAGTHAGHGSIWRGCWQLKGTSVVLLRWPFFSAALRTRQRFKIAKFPLNPHPRLLPRYADSRRLRKCAVQLGLTWESGQKSIKILGE
jgi:hypothetical protein